MIFDAKFPGIFPEPVGDPGIVVHALGNRSVSYRAVPLRSSWGKAFQIVYRQDMASRADGVSDHALGAAVSHCEQILSGKRVTGWVIVVNDSAPEIPDRDNGMRLPVTVSVDEAVFADGERMFLCPVIAVHGDEFIEGDFPRMKLMCPGICLDDAVRLGTPIAANTETAECPAASAAS